MADAPSVVFMDGAFVPSTEARVPILTHTLHYGLGAFEGIRAYRRADGRTSVFRLQDHIDRLFDSCKVIRLPIPFERAVVVDACLEVLRRNGLEQGYVRPLAYMGDGAMGIAAENPTRVAIAAWRWGTYLGDEALERGIRVKISSFSRHHIGSALTKAKIVGQYTNSILAKREAKLGGYDEALLLDPQGYVSEGSGENVFIVRKGVLVTPPLSSSILAGLTRDTVMTLAREQGIPVVEERLTRDQVWLADECFFTGTAAEVTPVRECDDRPIGDGKRGPVTEALQARYFDVVRGSDTSHPEWLTFT